MKYLVEYIKKEYKEIEADNAFDALAEANDKAPHGYEVKDFWPLVENGYQNNQQLKNYSHDNIQK